MGIPASLHSIANSLEMDPLLWRHLLDHRMPIMLGLPEDIQQRIIDASFGKRLIPDKVICELHEAMHSPFAFTEFDSYRKGLTSGKSPGPSGLTSTQIKH
jgi:hypothetical protein